jgi:hypothetical protein
MKLPPRLIGLFAGFAPLVFSGCHGFMSRGQTYSVPSVAAIDGLLQGQKVPVTAPGMALDDLIAQTMRPGALHYSDSDANSKQFFNQHAVALARGQSIYVIPIGLVQSTSAGSVYAAPGDQVNLLSLKAMLGDSTAANSAKKVFISGLHPLAGTTVRDAQATIARLQATATGDTAEVIRLAGAITHYYVPLSTTSGNSDPALNDTWQSFPLQNGDIVNFTDLESIGLIRAGRAVSYLTRQSSAANPQNGPGCHTHRLCRLPGEQNPLPPASANAPRPTIDAICKQFDTVGTFLKSRLPW